MKTKLYISKIILTVLISIISQYFAFCKNNGEVWPFSLNCPPNVTVSCQDEIWNLSIYGNATYSYGSNTYSAGAASIKYYLNSCNSGHITRTWLIQDNQWQWHSCTQTIYVSSGHTGGPYIRWPEDVELSGCNPETNPNKLQHPYNYPTWDYTECGMLGKSYSDMLFTVNSQCKKLMRVWKVMDWCQYSSTTGYALYTKVQFIYIINNTPPVINCPIEVVADASNCQNAFISAAPLSVDPGTCGGYFEISNNSLYAISKGNNLSGTYPIGTTKVIFTVKYACGLTKYCTTNVTVRNASKPVPYCHAHLITALMGVDTNKDGKTDNGMVEIWAKDLNRGSYSSCGNNPLKYSFSNNVNDTYRIFTCDHIGSNFVNVWVTDSKGAQNFCTVEIIVQNNGANIPDCKPKPVEPTLQVYAIKGKINTLYDYPINKASVMLSYKEPIVNYIVTYDTTETLLLDSFINMSGYKLYRYTLDKKIKEKRDSTISYISKTTKTNEDGKYQLDSFSLLNKPVVISATYKDSLHKDIDFRDVQLLARFLTGDIRYNSYHQFLASDVNEDGLVDTKDYQFLSDFVAGILDTLPGKNQWFLLDNRAVFNQPEDILESNYPFKVNLDSISKINSSYNFVAIKKGNISIDAGSFQQVTVEERSKDILFFDVTVSPNPFSNLATFNVYSSSDADANLTILNLNGLEIFSQRLKVDKGKQAIILELSELPAGLFLYRFTAGEKISVGKLIHIK